jgi:hypothetical protein
VEGGGIGQEVVVEVVAVVVVGGRGGGGAQMHVDRLVGSLRLLGLAGVCRRLVPGPTVVIVAPALLVGEDLVGLGNLHEHFFGALLLVLVGVVL